MSPNAKISYQQRSVLSETGNWVENGQEIWSVWRVDERSWQVFLFHFWLNVGCVRYFFKDLFLENSENMYLKLESVKNIYILLISLACVTSETNEPFID